MDIDSEINSLKKRALKFPQMVEETFSPLATSAEPSDILADVELFATNCFRYALSAWKVYKELSPKEHAPKGWLDSLSELKELASETSSEIKKIRSEWKEALKQPTRREQTATIQKARDVIHSHMVEMFLIYADMESTTIEWYSAINDFHKGVRKNFKRK